MVFFSVNSSSLANRLTHGRSPDPSQTAVQPVALAFWAGRVLALGVLLSVGMATAALAGTRQPQATAAARQAFRQEQQDKIRPEHYDLARYPLTEEMVGHWRGLLWATAIVEPADQSIDTSIAQLLEFAYSPNGEGFSSAQRSVVEMALQVGTQLLLSNTPSPQIAAPFQQVLERSENPRWVAIALSALAQATDHAADRRQWGDRVRQRFPNWRQEPILETTLRDVAELDSPSTLPPLQDLLDWQIAPDQMHAYVLCPGDRTALCRLMVKDRSGAFVPQTDGSPWSVPLRRRSLHGLRWNLTRGDTPQGIYRIEGVRSPSADTFRAYGQFPRVNLYVPHEAGVREFLPGQPGTVGAIAQYRALLPPSWRSYFPIYQSYWAGRIGRGLFRIHGSGEDPAFFANSARFPHSYGWSPAIGCLSALEQYDESGNLQQADMPAILQVLTQASGAVSASEIAGYLVVVEGDGVLE
ncbi:hypothetical protein [Leptolyngbya sp. O-77]|uniref:hypothetical protein n=1 Tax=Leptolyngbya sp. O-77 TaxID=1080068 RepID=UPI00074D2F28|nr:hypothetical protein [Leptolyngbya sp. O-77]BAU41314.1 hypothetical protein O77CONTIG1_01123 [Leptolyngbya sp. O-77]